MTSSELDKKGCGIVGEKYTSLILLKVRDGPGKCFNEYGNHKGSKTNEITKDLRQMKKMQQN